MLGAYLFVSASSQGCLIHLVPLLTDGGLSAEKAALAASLFGVANMIGRLCGGYLLDRVFAPYVVVATFCGAAIGIALLVIGPMWAFPATILLGLSAGTETDSVPYLVSRYFGLRAFGKIYSYIFITIPLGGAVGPLLVGLGFDSSGSYTVPLAVCSMGLVGAAAMMARLGPYPSAVVGPGAVAFEPVYAAEGD
jgi:predicted MFS family arabinose efflux permease